MKSNEAIIISQKDAKRIWDESWKEYLKSIKEQGLEDSRRIPTSEFMHRKCVI